ncbi:hypothetical protein GE061_002275 [Apolygus lucorum]|uniref:AMP-dependent synthetase/ligase domain-containing protein n=1 Tax=Apolygus lucorum TaxID=248454 RepID=A0A8S9X4N9_APOLU|nr:hypothetical protein GE061_002275 [Apolygus lucorum]
MNERISNIVKHWPSTKIGTKFFNGAAWSQCDYGHLRNDINLTTNIFQKLTKGGRVLVGFCVLPCLGLPALILGATLSSCPFVFLHADATNLSQALLRKLGLCWLITETPLHDQRFQIVESIELQSKIFLVYRYLDFPNNVKIAEGEVYLYATTTSGSTGSPKVVRVPEESILPNVLDFSFKIGLTANHGILLSTALTFDPSILEFFLALLNGSPCIIVSEDVRRSPALLLKAIQTGNVGFYQTTPSLFKLWNQEQKQQALGKKSNLKFLVLGGERFPSREEVKRWQPTPNVRIYNTYGLSEVSCWATLNLAFPNENWKNFSENGLDIGESLSETQIISTKDPSCELHHVMIGSSTRICAVENESFGELKSGKPIFRFTGDLFKIIDRKYYFCQRKDTTVKRLGKKINVSWMEDKCREVGLDCALSLRYSENREDYRLFMFIVGRRNSKPSREAIRSLKKILPGDHWPDAVVFVKSLPLSPHGKLDRIALESNAPQKSKYSLETFLEFWNLFSNGIPTETKPCKGFVASGGNSFTAVLMINNLKDAGFPDNPDLLLALIKNEPWDKCWSMVSPKKKARSKKRKNNAKDERENKMSPTQSNNDKNSQSQTNGYVIDTNMASTSVNEATLVRQERMKDSTVTPSQVISDRSIFSTGSKAVAEPKPSCSKSSIESRTCHEVPVLPMPSMALKGRVWPRDSPFFDEVWASKCRSILKSWSVDLQKCIDASPLGVMNNNCEDSFVIVGSHSGLVVVLKCETGEIISQTQLPDRVEASACLSSDHSFYYIGCYDGNIYRICIADGKIVWSFKTEDQVKSTCVLHLEKIFVGSYDEHIYALSEGGDLFWKQHVGPVTIPVLPFQSSIIVGTLTNKVLRLSTKDGSVLSKIEISFPLFSNLILTTYRGHRRCVLMAPVEGSILWCNAETLTQVEELVIQGSKFSSPVVSDQLTIIASGRTIHCLQFLKTIWTYEFHERIVSTPFTVGARLVVITIDGSLHLLDDTGVLLNTYKFPGDVFSSPIVIGSRVFVGCRDNNFYCLMVS